MLKKLITAIFIGCLLSSTNVKAAKFQDNQVVNSQKNWTIHFNQDISFDDLSKQGIIVTDSNGNNVSITLTLEQDNRSIKVTPPSNGYTPGEHYKLFINNKIHTKTSKNITEPITLNFSIEPDTDNTIVTFKDKNLEKAVRNTISKPIGNLYKKDVENITTLNAVSPYSISNTNPYSITDLAGIENLTDLQQLDLGNNTALSDITLLKTLPNLRYLFLYNTKVSDLSPLENLTNLENLVLNASKVKDLTPLSYLSNLRKLSLNCTEINDISALSPLVNLKILKLNRTPITNIDPLKNLVKLQYLDLSDTSVNNITALNGLTKLSDLNLNFTKVSDLNPLSNLTNLDTLYLIETNITDVRPLEGLINLYSLNLDCTDVPYANEEELHKALPQCSIHPNFD